MESTKECGETQASCQNMFCSEHEFCGEKNSRWDSACLCRAIFASKYRPTKQFGEPTMCQNQKATLTLAACLLEESGIDYNNLQLNDESCVGHMDRETHMVTFSFDNVYSCGTVVKYNGSRIIYHNTIKTMENTDSGIINRHEDLHLDFSCHYLQPDVQSMAIQIKDSSVVQELVAGEWRYNLSMIVYTDEARTQAVTPDTQINLDQRVYIEMKVDGLDEKLCPNPADRTIRVMNNGLGLSSYFSFNIFQFSHRAGNIYLHCQTLLCLNQENSCAPVVSMTTECP
ncbi:hypothetical protein WMY93_013928 [Mugilogobius chulae]|uniref:ZP domain-containing protein n=1 Tax=Mugilogobius chulae TaxID=88201 RepID=A0AAW0PBH0_9GOBI